MSDVLEHLAKVLETIKARNDPVDLKGGRPASSSFAQDIEELDSFLHKKTRPVSLSDLVRAIHSTDIHLAHPPPHIARLCRCCQTH